MIKKLLCCAAICFTFSTAPELQAASEPVTQDTYQVVGTRGEQTDVEGDWVDSEDITVQESELTRKVIQAEKAKNAAENDEYGFAITIIAMGIVLSALIILSILFLLFGKINTALHTRKKREAHGVADSEAGEHLNEADSGVAIAAIAMALAEHAGQGHDMEDTILTIRRMRKAYSPWNSKIYNIRQTPQTDNRNSAHLRALK